MTCSNQIFIIATLLLSAISITTGAPLASHKLAYHSPGGARHLLQTHGANFHSQDIHLERDAKYRPAVEPSETNSVGKAATAEELVTKKPAVLKKATALRKNTAEENAMPQKKAPTLKNPIRHRMDTPHRANRRRKGDRKAATKNTKKNTTKTRFRKTKPQQGYYHDRTSKHHGVDGDLGRRSSRSSTANMKRNAPGSGSVSPVSPGPMRHSMISMMPTAFAGKVQKKPAANLNKGLPPLPIGGHFNKAVQKARKGFHSMTKVFRGNKAGK